MSQKVAYSPAGSLAGLLLGGALGAGLGAWKADKGHRVRGAVAGGLPGMYMGESVGSLLGAIGNASRWRAGVGFHRAPPEQMPSWLRNAASQVEARSMYHQQARQAHPDMGGTNQRMSQLADEWRRAQEMDAFRRLKVSFDSGRRDAR